MLTKYDHLIIDSDGILIKCHQCLNGSTFKGHFHGGPEDMKEFLQDLFEEVKHEDWC